jgi:hypothetical protein
MAEKPSVYALALGMDVVLKVAELREAVRADPSNESLAFQLKTLAAIEARMARRWRKEFGAEARRKLN